MGYFLHKLEGEVVSATDGVVHDLSIMIDLNFIRFRRPDVTENATKIA